MTWGVWFLVGGGVLGRRDLYRDLLTIRRATGGCAGGIRGGCATASAREPVGVSVLVWLHYSPSSPGISGHYCVCGSRKCLRDNAVTMGQTLGKAQELVRSCDFLYVQVIES